MSAGYGYLRIEDTIIGAFSFASDTPQFQIKGERRVSQIVMHLRSRGNPSQRSNSPPLPWQCTYPRHPMDLATKHYPTGSCSRSGTNPCNLIRGEAAASRSDGMDAPLDNCALVGMSKRDFGSCAESGRGRGGSVGSHCDGLLVHLSGLGTYSWSRTLDRYSARGSRKASECGMWPHLAM